jgi:hypothetical protein
MNTKYLFRESYEIRNTLCDKNSELFLRFKHLVHTWPLPFWLLLQMSVMYFSFNHGSRIRLISSITNILSAHRLHTFETAGCTYWRIGKNVGRRACEMQEMSSHSLRLCRSLSSGMRCCIVWCQSINILQEMLHPSSGSTSPIGPPWLCSSFPVSEPLFPQSTKYFCHGDGGDTCLWNVNNYLSDYIVSHNRDRNQNCAIFLIWWPFKGLRKTAEDNQWAHPTSGL